MYENSIEKYSSTYDDYLTDESKFSGSFESISFPKDIDEMKYILMEMKKNKVPVTIQGSMTGICGGSVPVKGHAMNMSRFSGISGVEKVDGTHRVRVKCGTVLDELKSELSRNDLFWPPEPTETLATVGGVLATSAKGISHYHYGDVSNYVSELTVLDISGNVSVLTESDSSFSDYFGSEGMFGLVVECELKLIKIPKETWGIVFFFNYEKPLLKWLDNVRMMDLKGKESYVVAVEYIDDISLEHIYEMKETSSSLKAIPEVPEGTKGMVYVEIHGNDEDSVLEMAEELMETAEEYGSDPSTAWAVNGQKEVEKIRVMRHAAPESINNSIRTVREKKTTGKLATDIMWKDRGVSETVEYYRKSAYERGLEISIFGHVMDNHLHVNILYKDYAEYETGKQMLLRWSEDAFSDNADVFNEHGIGKIKKDIYINLISKNKKDLLKQRKNLYDPDGLWNPGNVFD
ncbi:FAD/FMN-containing dehydrogenase [Dethiosulfatibacter aminovorans DSM 17477]|uniref:D-lactate dehydrogenase (cytochrome) n=1 Tax=Dethiosulfatibacter aminovorans DSM 17477 TaxID=1121476 RepID=A0A1M6IYI3_9FIRM|nr:FAD-binding oxidoreductase [Dethiosulfatibacter aminovorans]SHJ39499.1 FAD/FMN-containing dehydrogenase [Dethiosulfatibacter aminovorans DSM 17477]